MKQIMIDKIGVPAMYEQLAEECDELAQKALKESRALRGENPPRMTMDEIHDGLEEEVADVWVCVRELSIEIDDGIVTIKTTDEIGLPAMYERLAYRCNNVATTALIISRILRGDDPYDSVLEDEMDEFMDFLESLINREVSEVWECLDALNLKIDPKIVKFKEDRFLKGWKEDHHDEQEEV